jgi:hypothetical protein
MVPTQAIYPNGTLPVTGRKASGAEVGQSRVAILSILAAISGLRSRHAIIGVFSSFLLCTGKMDEAF